jgi:hypothetical protein
MKTFNQFLEEQKQDYIVHGQAGGKSVSHETSATSHDHAKRLFKKAMKDKGHKTSTTIAVRTKAEDAEHKRKSEASSKARDEKVAKTHADMDKNKEYWADRQKSYDSQSHKGD